MRRQPGQITWEAEIRLLPKQIKNKQMMGREKLNLPNKDRKNNQWK